MCVSFISAMSFREGGVRLTFSEAQKLLREEETGRFRLVTDDGDMSTSQKKALGTNLDEVQP